MTWHRNLFLFCFVSFALEYLQCGHYQSGLFWLVFITVVSTGHPSNISIFSTNDKYWRIETAHGFWRVCAFFVLVLEKIRIIFIFSNFYQNCKNISSRQQHKHKHHHYTEVNGCSFELPTLCFPSFIWRLSLGFEFFSFNQAQE